MADDFQDQRATDLFGNPVRSSKGRRGRPPLEITSEERDMVEAALARGWTNQRIAETLRMSPASLKRYFRSALVIRDQARDRLELAAFARVTRAAIEDGNMSAMRQLREMMAQDVIMSQKAELRRRQKEAADAGIGTGTGKKQIQQREAEAAAQADDWGDLLGSKGMH